MPTFLIEFRIKNDGSKVPLYHYLEFRIATMMNYQAQPQPQLQPQLQLQQDEPFCSLCGFKCAEVKLLDCNCQVHVVSSYDNNIDGCSFDNLIVLSALILYSNILRKVICSV